MPGGDGTGPMGMGPMTGRAAGYCAGYPVPGFMNAYGGRFAGPYGGFGAGNVAPQAGWGMPYGAMAQPYGYRPPMLPTPWGGMGMGMGMGMGFRRGFGMGRGRGRRGPWW